MYKKLGVIIAIKRVVRGEKEIEKNNKFAFGEWNSFVGRKDVCNNPG